MDRAIGVFDSGLGGVSVLKQARARLPHERFIYYGDNGNAPYGGRPVEEIRELTRKAVSKLVEQGVKALVLACNTATSASVQSLRAELSLPVIGMEPALKPAHTLRHGGQILVVATKATLALEKFRTLMERYGEGAEPIVGKGLPELVEAGKLDGPEVEQAVSSLLAPYLRAPVDAIVLGCTHYIFLKEAFAKAAPGVPLVDGNEGTVRQLERVLAAHGLLRTQGEGSVTLQTSGQPGVYLPLMERLLRI